MHKIRKQWMILALLAVLATARGMLANAHSDSSTSSDVTPVSVTPASVDHATLFTQKAMWSTGPADPVGLQAATTFTYPIYLPVVAMGQVIPITPNDTFLGLQWGLDHIQAEMAWGLSMGSPTVTIAVVDTGVDPLHPDLSAKLVPGHNFSNGQNDTNYQDDCGHGTHVAGIAAAATNNGTGVAGLGWNTKIMPVKVLSLVNGQCTGSDADVINGINWAVSNGAQVINLSLGGTDYNPLFDQATTAAYNSGVLVVAAAGNCSGSYYLYNGCSYPDQVIYPAGNAHVLGVAATADSSDAHAPFSSANTSVDIAAPGMFIYSTVPGASYGYKSGTSMATPFVSGLASLVYARFPTYTPTQVAQAIVANTDLVGGNTGWSQAYGCGRINAYRALANGASGSCAEWSGLSVTGLGAGATPRQTVAGRDYVPGEVLVMVRAGDDRTWAQKIADRYGFAMSDLVPRWRMYRLHVPVGQEQAALDALRADSSIEAAGLNGIVRPQ